MPASLPGSTASANTTGNPAAGAMVLINPFSGPKGSPFDKDQAGSASTGALSTGIGFGSPPVLGSGQIKPQFNDDYIPGVSYFTSATTMQSATTAILTCIGGGKSSATANGVAETVPYNAQPILAAGNGGSRDAGAGPAFTGFSLKTVTASATVANGAAVETGFTNRSGVSIVSGQSVFGSSTAASAAVS